jgi:hypothetical protein
MHREKRRLARREFLSGTATTLACAAAATLSTEAAATGPNVAPATGQAKTETGQARQRSLVMGVVTEGRLAPFERPDARLRLTEIAPVEAVPPGSREIALAGHEGKAVLVLGQRDSAWVYSAKLLDVVGVALGLLAWRSLRDQDAAQYLP